MQFQVGLIRVLTTQDQEVLLSHGKKIEQFFPQLQVESRCIPDQPEGIHDDETKAIALPKIVALAREFADKDAIIVSCADDPGVALIQEIYSKPVIGAGSSVTLLSAPGLGRKVGILGITEIPPVPYLSLPAELVINLGTPEGVHCTLDLMTPAGQAACMAKAKELMAAGAESIALACTGFSTVNLAPVLERELGIPVLDPVLCEGLMAYFALIRTVS